MLHEMPRAQLSHRAVLTGRHQPFSMRGLSLAGLAFAALIASAFGAVENLTDGTFEDKVSGTLTTANTPTAADTTHHICLAAGGTWFVKFYAPVSQSMLPALHAFSATVATTTMPSTPSSTFDPRSGADTASAWHPL